MADSPTRERGLEVLGAGVMAGCRAGEGNEPEPHPAGTGDEIIARTGPGGIGAALTGFLAMGVLAAGRDHTGRADEVELGEQPGQRGGGLTGGVLRGLDQGAVHRGDRKPSATVCTHTFVKLTATTHSLERRVQTTKRLGLAW
jgi:hypothetical protein